MGVKSCKTEIWAQSNNSKTNTQDVANVFLL